MVSINHHATSESIPFLKISLYSGSVPRALLAPYILPVKMLPRASTNPESAFFTCPPYKDNARQVSKPCRACPLFVKHRIPANFRSPISTHGHRASTCPPQKIFPCVIRFETFEPEGFQHTKNRQYSSKFMRAAVRDYLNESGSQGTEGVTVVLMCWSHMLLFRNRPINLFHPLFDGIQAEGLNFFSGGGTQLGAESRI